MSVKDMTTLQKSLIVAGLVISISSIFATFDNLYSFLRAIAPYHVDISSEGITSFFRNVRWIILLLGASVVFLGVKFKRVSELWRMPDDDTEEPSFRTRMLLIFAFALGVRLISLRFSDNCHWDGVLRIYNALRWMEKPHLITHGMWGPLHTYLISLALMMYDNVLVSPVLMNAILGSLIIFPLSYIVRREFGDRIALYSAVIYSIYPVAFRYSLLSFSEIPYNFLLFLSLSLLFLSRERNNSRLYVFLAAIFLNLAGMLRYEAWALIPAFSLFLLRERRALFLFLATSAIFPVFWMAGNYVEHGDPLFSVNVIYRLNVMGFKINEGFGPFSFIVRLLFWPVILTMGLTPLIAFLALLGASISIYRRRRLGLLSIFLFLLSIFIWKSESGTLFLKSRYSITLALLLIPYSAYGLSAFLSSIRGSKARAAAFVVVLLSVLPFSYAAGKVTEGVFFLPKAPDRYHRVVRYLNGELRPHDNILVDHFDDWKEGYIALYTVGTYKRAYHVPGPDREMPVEEIRSYIDDQRPRFMVTSERGRLIPFIENDSEFLGYSLVKCFEVGDLKVYRFRY